MRSRGAALATLLGVLFLTFLDTTIVSVTLGDLQSDLGAGVVPLQWVINGYALAFAALMLLGGSLGDRLGRRRVMVAGIVIFAFGSLLCVLGSSVGWVIAGRVVMGVGAAASEPGTLSVIRQLYPDAAERARALGAWSAVSGLALALGPVVGGLLVGWDGWRAVFWFNLVAAVVLLVATLRTVPESRDVVDGRIDWGGSVLAAAGLGVAIYAAIAGEYRGYSTWWIVALFVLGGLLLASFVVVETRVASPLLDLAYVRAPVVSAALLGAFAVYFGVFAIFFCTALYLDIALAYSGPRLAGMFAPMAAAIVVGGLLAGRWVARVGTRMPTVVGCVVAAAGMLLARYELGRGEHFSFALLSLALALAGLGFGITVVPLTSAVLGHLPSRLSGMAASATNTARQLGAVVGVAALGGVLNAHLIRGVDNPPAELKLAIAIIGKERIKTYLETGGGSLSDLDPRVIKAFAPPFLDGLQVALVIATALILLAGLAAALARAGSSPVDQVLRSSDRSEPRKRSDDRKS